MVGRTVVGRFRVERIIGRGGMASVYAAVDERSGKKIAIKLLKRELTRDPTVLRRFEREAKAASHLRHPNIIEVFESGIEGEDAFIAMELANGKDLLKALSQERPMRQVRAVLILAQVCAALDAAHTKGIVHRDLKPENIVLVNDPTEPGGERAKVLDFGIAKILDVSGKPGSGDPTDPPSYVTKTALTRVGTIVGTPAYMSPEQCRGGDLDGRSDLYTCGVLLYQLVTGELPFTGETPLHTAMRHIHAQPRPVNELRRDVSPALERNILKALAKWPGERHQSAAQLREELLACLPELPDKGDVVLPEGFIGNPTPSKRISVPDGDQAQPTRMLVGGPLGSTPLRAVRLGGPGAPLGQPSAPPAGAPAPPVAGSQPPPAPTQPDDDDDEPRTFLMSPEAAERSREAAGSPAPAKVQVRTEALPSTPPPANPAPARAASAPPPPAAPAPPPKSPVRTTQLGGIAADRAGNITARLADAAVAHAKTAPAGGAPTAPTTQAPRSPSRSERPLRTPRAPTPSTAPRPGIERPAPPVNLRTPKTTETGLTPTTQTTVPSSNDPPTRKKDPSPSPQPTPVIDPLSATAAGAPPGSPTTDPSRRLDDDEIPTGQRDPGPPDRRGGVHTTLVMEETAAGSTRAPDPHSHAPRGQVPREMAIAPTLLAGKNSPTAAQVEAEALRALKETTRMSPEEAAASQAALAQQIAQRNATMRMNPQDGYGQPSGGGVPPAALARPMPGPPGAPQAMPQGSGGALGWNEATVMRRRQPGSDQLAPGKAGLVGELESLPGTTGFLIGIGLGLGIAAGVVIALLVMR
ncbi:MAG: protein kinase [Polyangiaceae bacterium]|nr:protein kinase [Polyangiaceae bacterium]